MKLSALSSYLNAELQGSDAVFESVSTDTRKIKPGEFYVALKGENFDGHKFLDQAVDKGAIAALVDRKVALSIPTIQVANTRLALGEMGAWRREQLDLPVIALTGSCGKTTVKEMIRNILAQCGSVLANQGTLNNDVGLPLTLLQLQQHHQYAVLELGANHPGEIAYLTGLAQPNVAFINNIAPAHLEGFGSIEGVARAKAEIFNGLSKDGIALINADDSFAPWLTTLLSGRRVLRFGLEQQNLDFSARDIVTNEQGHQQFVLLTPAGETKILLPLLGRHNVLNAVAAAAASFAVGANLEAINIGLTTMQPVAGRLVTLQGFGGARIFDDTYNANPSSVKAALQVLSQYSGDRVFIMGDMGELGDGAEDYHREIGHMAKQIGINQLYACGRLSTSTVEAFGTGGHHFADQSGLSDAVRAILHPAMTVLIKGSRSAKMENVVAALVDGYHLNK